MSLLTISKPTEYQIKHGAERILVTFLVASVGFLKLAHFDLSKSTLHGAFLAGCVAVWQLVISFTTETL